jgi:hypothetical protein
MDAPLCRNKTNLSEKLSAAVESKIPSVRAGAISATGKEILADLP